MGLFHASLEGLWNVTDSPLKTQVGLIPLGLQVPAKKVRSWSVFRRLTTFLEGIWSPRVLHVCFFHFRRILGYHKRLQLWVFFSLSTTYILFSQLKLSGLPRSEERPSQVVLR